MGLFLICFLAGICGAIIWSSVQDSHVSSREAGQRANAKDRLEYILISWDLLADWLAWDSRLIVIDFRSSVRAGFDADQVTGSLRISREYLIKYLWYLPPDTRLVLHDRSSVARLDSASERVLRILGIEAVYVLDEITPTRQSDAQIKKNVMELSPRQALEFVRFCATPIGKKHPDPLGRSSRGAGNSVNRELSLNWTEQRPEACEWQP
jgi:hypothetical protein